MDEKELINDLLNSNGGLFVFNCNYAVDKLNISNLFYYELLLWWSELHDLGDCYGEYKYIWNSRKIKIDETYPSKQPIAIEIFWGLSNTPNWICK